MRTIRSSATAAALLFALVCLLAVTFTAVPVYAQPVPLADTPIEVQIWPGGVQGYTLFIVTGQLPAGTPLPALVRLPIPEGADVFWSGEILGGPATMDPVREFAIVDGIGGPALEMTAEETLTVQYEATGSALTVVDGLVTSEFEWVQSTEAGEVVFAVRIPASAGVVRIEPDSPGPPVMNEAGERLYALTPVLLPEGATYSITAQYGPEGAGTASRPQLLWWLGLLLGLAILVLVLVVIRQRGVTVTPAEEE